MEYSPVACMRQSSHCCRSDSLGCLLCNSSLGAGDGHALAGAHADEIGPELGEGGEEIEEQLCHRIALFVERPAEGQFHASFPSRSAMAWASGANLISRLSFGTTSVSPSRRAARASTTAWPGSTCSPPSSTGMRPSRRSGQTAETCRTDSRARAPDPHLTPWVGPHPGHRRIPVAKRR